MAESLVKNTISFKFPDGAAGPSLVEVARFVKAFDADKKTMESTYKIAEERSVFIKFKTQDSMKEALAQNPEAHTFEYSNGDKVTVKMGIAGGLTKYVRIFELPPEVPDSDVVAVLSKYGSVKRIVREKFPAELELDLYTGVRGVYLDLKKEIPMTLYFLNRRGRIYYEGLKQKCFLCKMEGHLKMDCPQNKKQRVVQETKNNTGAQMPKINRISEIQPTYSAALQSSGPPVQTGEKELNMVKLVSMRNQPRQEKPAGGEEVDRVEVSVADKVLAEGRSESSDNNNGDMEIETQEGANTGLKRTHSDGSTASVSADDDGFVRPGRSKTRRAKKSSLEALAVEPKTASSGKVRSSSQK